jgi:hypothetical protein
LFRCDEYETKNSVHLAQPTFTITVVNAAIEISSSIKLALKQRPLKEVDLAALTTVILNSEGLITKSVTCLDELEGIVSSIEQRIGTVTIQRIGLEIL